MASAVEYKTATSAGSQTPSYTLLGKKGEDYSTTWAMIGDAITPAPTIAASTLSVSAYTTDSQGNIQNTIFTNLNTNNIGSSIGSVETIFTTTTASVPADGYILVKLTAPAGTTVTVNWGPSTPTNFQVIYAYS